MEHDLQLRLADNARQWRALSLAISQAEQATFARVHDELLAAHGAPLMAQVYRATFEAALQNMPETERTKLLVAFGQVLDQAVAGQPPMLAPHDGAWVL